MNRLRLLLNICSIAIFLSLTGCTEEEQTFPETDPGIMKFDIVHPFRNTRVTATQFEEHDRIGLFITEATEPLQLIGNYVNNALLAFTGSTWHPAAPVWYNNGTYNVYAYYPYSNVYTSVDDYPFNLTTDQSTPTIAGVPGGYEASDFLWASQAGVTASDSPVTLKFSHCMSRIVVRLIKGSDYEGDIPADAQVYIHNTVTSATIDLSVGIATVHPRATTHTIRARSEGNLRYTAIVVPQRLANRRPLVEVVMKGVSYLMESNFIFKPGIQHTVSLIISRNPERVKIEFGGENEDWD